MNKHSPNLKKGNFSTLPTTKLTDKMVYEHYTNGVYNGIKRVGRRYGCGITLFDNGRCAITNYNKD